MNIEMKKHKIDQVERTIVYENSSMRIDLEESGDYYFEIGNQITNDIGEGVAILMRIRDKKSDNIWNTKISNIESYNIEPERALYWLTGGDDEWKKRENYKLPWSECYLNFEEKFGEVIISIIKGSKNLGEIRDGFRKSLNLPKLYNFAIEVGMV